MTLQSGLYRGNPSTRKTSRPITTNTNVLIFWFYFGTEKKHTFKLILSITNISQMAYHQISEHFDFSTCFCHVSNTADLTAMT